MREEKQRVERSNGVVRQSVKQGRSVGVMRVWCKGQDYPGLAMSRSLGDKLAQNVGVSCDPSIK
jgi:Protein phosphatase 2C